MYCSKCGYEINEKKAKQIKEATSHKLDTNKIKRLIKSELEGANEVDATPNEVVYVCPRCGALIHKNLVEPEYKVLSQAAHSEVHKAGNLRNAALCSGAISIIVLAVSFLFCLMSFKVANKGLIDTNCIEFYVFIVLLLLGTGLLVYFIIAFTIAQARNHKYSKLIIDIQNKTFVQ